MTEYEINTKVCPYCLEEAIKSEFLEADQENVRNVLLSATAGAEPDEKFPSVCRSCYIRMLVNREFHVLQTIKSRIESNKASTSSQRSPADANEPSNFNDTMLISDVRTLSSSPSLLTEIGSCRYEDREEAFEIEQARSQKNYLRNSAKRVTSEVQKTKTVAKRRQSRSRSLHYDYQQAPLRISIGCRIELALYDDFHEFSCKKCLEFKIASLEGLPKRRESWVKSLAAIEKTPRATKRRHSTRTAVNFLTSVPATVPETETISNTTIIPPRTTYEIPKWFKCSVAGCNSVFINMSDCVEHEYKKHCKMLTHNCKNCSEWFTSKLFYHIHDDLTHTRICVCYKCDEVFTKLHLLDEHMRTHDGDRKCITCCSYHFADKEKYYKYLYKKFDKEPARIRILERHVTPMSCNTSDTTSTASNKFEYKSISMIYKTRKQPGRRRRRKYTTIKSKSQYKFGGICIYEKRISPSHFEQMGSQMGGCESWVNDFSDSDDSIDLNEIIGNTYRKQHFWRDRFSLLVDNEFISNFLTPVSFAQQKYEVAIEPSPCDLNDGLFSGPIGYGREPIHSVLIINSATDKGPKFAKRCVKQVRVVNENVRQMPSYDEIMYDESETGGSVYSLD